ncbi:glycosyltransferase [Aestuariispira insulae]|uniref:Glycosyltransferase involved in cell wall biosynthesis n=1 Tax=Aestuariispira insulae TaxID=1461337 RepID=A0A3D9H2P6_9PROT|nr:glycosyltransferase [Aestuariispira insulae]RED43788.1 glycosyltransferase involved in cell wall biosynthesis [Aestuariispira insulae]
MKDIKTLIVVQHLRPGGIECLALDFLEHLPGTGSLLVSLEGNIRELVEHWPRIQRFEDRIIALEKQPGWDWRCLMRLARLIRETQPDVVHCHHIGPLLYGGIGAKWARCPLVHTEHDAWHLMQPKRRMLQKLAVSFLSPAVIADAHQVAINYENAIGRKTDAIILNGIDTNRFAPGDKSEARTRLGLPVGKQIFGMAGRLVPVKNTELLIRAFSSIAKETRHLAIAGAGPQEDHLKSLVSQLGLETHVSFLDHVEKMPDFYRSLDRFVLPSLSEGLPLCLLEAQACGTAVIATDVGAVKEAVCPDTGTLVESDNARQLSAAMCGSLWQRLTPEKVRSFTLSVGCRDVMLSRYLDAYSAAR